MFFVPVCRYPPVPCHQHHITQLPRPQVALHLGESDICMGHSSEHRLLWTRTGLHGHTRRQCGAAVWGPGKDKLTQKGDKSLVCMCRCWVLLFYRERQMRGQLLFFFLMSFLHVSSPSPFMQGHFLLPDKNKDPLMLQLLGVNDQINLAHLKERLPIK